MMSRLKYKCSCTLLVLMEARKDDEIVYRMMKSFNIDYIQRNLIDTYHVFQDYYDGKYQPEIF